MESQSSKSSFSNSKASRPALHSPSSLKDISFNTSPDHSLITQLPLFHSPTTTPNSPNLKSPVAKLTIPTSCNLSPCKNSCIFKTPSPSHGHIPTWHLSDCLRSPIQIHSPTPRALKFKSPKSEVGDCIEKSPLGSFEIVEGRSTFKRVGVPLIHPTPPARSSKSVKLFHSPKGESSTPPDLPKWVEVVDISDDDDHKVKEQGKKEKMVEGQDQDVHDAEVRRLVAMMENATTSLFTDLENLVCSVGQMMEATIGICNHVTRGA